MRLTVLLISNMYPSKTSPSYGVFVKNFVEDIGKDFKVSLIVIKGREKNKVKKLYKYFIFWNKLLFSLLFRNYDLVYIHYPSHVSIPIWLITRFKKFKFVLNFHGDDAVTTKNIVQKIFHFFLKETVKNATLIVVPSNFFKNVVKKTFNIALDEKIYIYHSGGVDTDVFKPLPKNKCKKKFGFSKNDIVIGFVSSIYEGKGWRIYLKIINKLHSINPRVKGIMVGYGHEEIELIRELKNLDSKKVIKFLGKKEQKELVYIYNSMEVFIFPTLLNESLGLVGLEAMACGVPVVGSRLGGLQDYIKDGYNGFLCTPGDVEDFSKKVLKIIENKDTWKIFSQNCCKIVNLFDKSIINKRLIEKIKGEL